MTEIQNIPYFDGHCDTIWRCMKREAVPDYGATEDECRAYFSACARPAGKQGPRGPAPWSTLPETRSVFCPVRRCTRAAPNTAWTKLREMHDWFLSQIQENSDLVSRCKTGAEVDAAAARHRTAALLSVEGADLLDCALDTWKPWPRGVRLITGLNNANVLSGSCADERPRIVCLLVVNSLQKCMNTEYLQMFLTYLMPVSGT